MDERRQCYTIQTPNNLGLIERKCMAWPRLTGTTYHKKAKKQNSKTAEMEYKFIVIMTKAISLLM